MINGKEINVTKTNLPSLAEYDRWLKKVWQNGWLTNNGEMVRRLEARLKKYLGVKHLCVVANGTLALQFAVRALGITKDVIVTPFSYVATVSSLVWEGGNAVFADIDPETFNIRAERIEAAVTKNTQAIIATHVYGNPCDVEAIGRISRMYKIPIIYDAAHGFGVMYKNRSLASYGDVAILSFHATKIFHTGEGGAVITRNKKLLEKLIHLRNFGHEGREAFWGLGINGKMSELHAAMGLCMLPKVSRIIKKHKQLSKIYDEYLDGLPLKKPVMRPRTTYNYAYYPVLFESEKRLKQVQDRLNKNHIIPRRYFYPSLDSLNYVRSRPMKVARSVSERVLCLPLSSQLAKNEIKLIVEIIKKAVQQK